MQYNVIIYAYKEPRESVCSHELNRLLILLGANAPSKNGEDHRFVRGFCDIYKVSVLFFSFCFVDK